MSDKQPTRKFSTTSNWLAGGVAFSVIALYAGCAALTFAVTVLPWLIGIGWMMHHWLGVS